MLLLIFFLKYIDAYLTRNLSAISVFCNEIYRMAHKPDIRYTVADNAGRLSKTFNARLSSNFLSLQMTSYRKLVDRPAYEIFSNFFTYSSQTGR